MSNIPFWVAHCILWIIWLIGKVVRSKIIFNIFDVLVASCFGAMIMWFVMQCI